MAPLEEEYLLPVTEQHSRSLCLLLQAQCTQYYQLIALLQNRMNPIQLMAQNGQHFQIDSRTQEEQLTNWMKQCKMQYSVKRIGRSNHLRNTSDGFQIEFVEGKIETFFGYFRTSKIGEFKGILPYDINANWTIKTAVMYLGEPPTKSKHLLQIIYDNLGVGLVFQGNWDKQDSKIEYIYTYEKSKKKVCSNCKKQIEVEFKSCRCGIVQYCSQKCRDKHFGHHLIFCQTIQD